MAQAAKNKSAMSAEHKEALALGREQSRAVRRYLEALERHRPRRGRKRTPDSIRRQLGAIEQKLADADPLERLNLLQDRENLQSELASMEEGVDLTALEEEFVKAAKPYSERKGISYSVWREIGVDPSVLRRAGIGRGSRD
ncbi:MAG TPA: hypothetical protein VFA11_00485 [Acidimicrobiales bacterium]|nr:hypothetical protein [Acidimicrobiales bacterium]